MIYPHSQWNSTADRTPIVDDRPRGAGGHRPRPTPTHQNDGTGVIRQERTKPFSCSPDRGSSNCHTATRRWIGPRKRRQHGTGPWSRSREFESAGVGRNLAMKSMNNYQLRLWSRVEVDLTKFYCFLVNRVLLRTPRGQTFP